MLEPMCTGNRQKHLSKNPVLQQLLKKFNSDLTRLAVSVKPLTVLDVGCGEGFSTYAIASKLSNAQITAIDVDPFKLNYAKRNKVARNISYQILDVFKLGQTDTKYDLVVCNEVLEHLPNYERALVNLTAVTKRHLIISVPNEPWFQLANAIRFKYLSRLGNSPQHINRWSTKQFCNLLKRHGSLVKITHSTFWNIALLKISSFY